MKSPVETAVIHPRRKLGQAKLGRGTLAVLLTKGDLENLMHLRLSEASTQLGLSATTVKKICRKMGIYNWSSVSPREHCDHGHHPSPSPPSTRYNPDFNSVPAPLSAPDAMTSTILIDRSTTPVKLEHASSYGATQPSLAFAQPAALSHTSEQTATDESVQAAKVQPPYCWDEACTPEPEVAAHTLYPQPATLNPQPETRNPKP